MSIKFKKAFALLEFTIYSGIFSFFVLLIFDFFSREQRHLLLMSKQNEKIVRNLLAMDLLKRDLLSASSYVEDWDENDFVFRKMTLNKKVQQIVFAGRY